MGLTQRRQNAKEKDSIALLTPYCFFICANLRKSADRFELFSFELSTQHFPIQFSILPCYLFDVKTGHRLIPGLYAQIFMSLVIRQYPVNSGSKVGGIKGFCKVTVYLVIYHIEQTCHTKDYNRSAAA